MSSLSPEHRAAIAAGLRGKSKSEEHRAAISEAKRGTVVSEETRAKMSLAGKGKPKSPEHRAAISAALKAVPRIPATGYHAVHSQMGAASEQLCSCGSQALDWAYQYTCPEPLYSPEGWPYSLDPADYLPMCRPCHKRLDHANQ